MISSKKKETVKIENISKYHEFLFSDEGILPRYLPGFGEGEIKEMDRELEENENESKLVAESENDSEDTQSQNDVDGSLWKFDSDDDADADDAKHPERMSFTPDSARILIKASTLSRYLSNRH